MPATPTRAAPLPPQERRATIVAATLPLLRRSGPNVTTREIAEAAGVAEGTLFRVFADKDEIVRAVVEAACDPGPCEAELRSIDASAPLPDVVTAAVDALRRRLETVWQVLGMLRSGEVTAGRSTRHVVPPRPDLSGIEDALTDLLTPHRDELRRPTRTAAHMVHMVTLAGAHPVLSAGTPTSTAEIVDLLLHGLAAPASPAPAMAASVARTSGGTPC